MRHPYQYQRVQVAVAFSIIKESPSYLHPRDFANNLQKVILTKVVKEAKHINDNIDEDQQQQHYGPTDITGKDRKFYEKDNPGCENLKSPLKTDVRSIQKVLKRTASLLNIGHLTSGNEVHSCEDLLPYNSLLELDENKTGVPCDSFKKKRYKKVSDPLEKVFGKDAISSVQVANKSSKPPLLREPLSKGPLDSNFLCERDSENVKIKGNTSVSRKILDLKDDWCRCMGLSCDLHSVATAYEICEKKQSKNKIRRHMLDATEAASSSLETPSNKLVLNFIEVEEDKTVDKMNRLLTSGISDIEELVFKSQWAPENNNIAFSLNSPDDIIMEHDLESSSKLFESEIVSRNKEKTTYNSQGRESAASEKVTVSIKEFRVSLISILKEMQYALRMAYFGFYPCWTKLQCSLKVIIYWLHHHEEHFKRKTEEMSIKVISTLLSLLFQFNFGPRAEECASFNNIWWIILFEVRGLLMSLCTTPILWWPSGNLLVKALLFICQRASSGILAEDTEGLHMSEVAFTLAEVLNKVIVYAASLPLLALDSLQCESGDTTKTNSSIEAALFVLDPTRGVSDSLTSFHQHEYGSPMVLQEDFNFSEDSFIPLMLETAAETVSGVELWKLRIESALHSLPLENFDFGCENDHTQLRLPSGAITPPTSQNSYDAGVVSSIPLGNPMPDISSYKSNLQVDPSIKSMLLHWKSLLQRECLPLLKNASPMLYLQIKDICNLIDE